MGTMVSVLKVYIRSLRIIAQMSMYIDQMR